MEMPEIIATFDSAPRLTTDFTDEHWQGSVLIEIACEWDGQPASAELNTTARMLWNEREIMLGFECGYTELDVDEEFDPAQERYALWDRDVCELFLRSPNEPHDLSYREFEVAPTGQWCDLLIDRSRMWRDWRWKSGMRTAADIDPESRIWRAVMAIPFDAFGCRPESGDCWYGNLFRISRLGGQRRYLSYSPTLTAQPNFHVADRFSRVRFAPSDRRETA